MDERFEGVVRAGADREIVAALVQRVLTGHAHAAGRMDPIKFAEAHGFDPVRCVDAFVIAAHLGLLDMSFSMVCTACGCLLEPRVSISRMQGSYPCSMCSMTAEPMLDDRIEVNFAPNKDVRRLVSHTPSKLRLSDYYRYFHFGAALSVPEGEAFDQFWSKTLLGGHAVAANKRRSIPFTMPDEPLSFLFEPNTHSTVFLQRAEGLAPHDPQEVTVTYSEATISPAAIKLHPGPVRLWIDNRMQHRLMPAVWAGSSVGAWASAPRLGFLTGKTLFTNQTFRDLFKTGQLGLDQRLKVQALTVLFTDLKGSTELYERVGDLKAYDLVRGHFDVLTTAVRHHGGAVVKTIGDAVMATFPTPAHGLASALAMQDEIERFNQARGSEDVLVKIGLHHGPCLAVVLNERLDYFGQTVNIAARVQGLATEHEIFATEPIVADPAVGSLLTKRGVSPRSQRASLKGVKDEMTVFALA